MSGIEVVGILLGAIPLVISALEHYKEGINAIGGYRKYPSALKSLKTKLRIQEELYRGTLRLLLSSELSPLEVYALFPDPDLEGSSPLWGTKDIEDKLRKKLDTQFDLFKNVVDEMETIMEKLMEKLDIDINGKPKWRPIYTTDARFRDRFAWEWRRIHRSFGKAEREELISKFERYNNNLASLVYQREKQVPRPNGRGKGIVRYLGLMRNQACELHSILGDNWKCTCDSPHKAYLRLQHPSEASSLPVKFGVTFPSRQTSTIRPEVDEQESSFWQHTSISISKLDSKSEASAIDRGSSVLLSTSASQTSQISVKFSSLLKVTPRETRTARVRFLETTITETKPTNVMSLDSLTVSPFLQTNVCSTAISLCNILCKEIPAGNTLGPFFNSTEDQVALITTDTSQESSKPLCLNKLLSEPVNSPKLPRKLSDKDRLKIALTLSSTVLQLYDSPWIDSAWSGQDIRFLTAQSANSYEVPLIGPFVSTSFHGPTRAEHSRQLTPTSDPLFDRLIPNKILFGLAIMLIELCLGKTLGEMRQSSPGEGTESRKTTLLDDFETANQLLDSVYLKSGSNYGDVVQRCLKCEFNIMPKEKQMGFERFRHLFYEGVVAPLEENYRKYLLYWGDI